MSIALEHPSELVSMEPLKDSELPTIFGVPLKYVSLATVQTQSSFFTDLVAHDTKFGFDSGLLAKRPALIYQIMHYSRVMHVRTGRYFTSTAVLLAEVFKFVFCAVVVVMALMKRKRREGDTLRWKDMWSEMFGGDAWKLSIPAGLYTVACFPSILISHPGSE